MDELQEFLDRFYHQHGPCCAGCDWWRHLNSKAGECQRSAPVSEKERFGMLGISGLSAPLSGAGHVLTARDHLCGDFLDNFNWETLPLGYRKRIGQLNSRASAAPPTPTQP